MEFQRPRRLRSGLRPLRASEWRKRDSYSVNLASVGEQKIAVMKAVKEVLGLGLKEAKDLVDGAPSVLKEGVKKPRPKR